MSRTRLSRPLRQAIEDGLVHAGVRVFDYGCGHGGDLERLAELSIPASGWDPTFRPDARREEAQVVNLGYVINVIEDPDERSSVLQDAWRLTGKCLVVSARLSGEAPALEAERFADGCLTRAGTFQKFFEQHELRDWIDARLEVRSVAAAPGVFYVFREESDRQGWLASRFRRRSVAPRVRRKDALFEAHRPLFDALMEFVAWRGRMPVAEELEVAPELARVCGSLKRAFTIVTDLTARAEWERIADERAQDVLVHVALSQFDGRPAFSALPSAIQLDVKSFFGTYKRACELADTLLYATGNTELLERSIREAPVGKRTPSALYVHISALGTLPPILRAYEGCARMYIGQVEGANLIKLHRESARISYLTYPDFDSDPHPALDRGLSVSLQTFRIRTQRYDRSANPPILHRKEEFVGPNYPGREMFARLTQQEERWGLYEKTTTIGTREGWNTVLERVGVRLKGHRVVVSALGSEQA